MDYLFLFIKSEYELIFPSNVLYIESAPRKEKSPIHKLLIIEISVKVIENIIPNRIFIIREYKVMYLLFLKKIFVFCINVQVIVLKIIDIRNNSLKKLKFNI